jgi:Mad1 and Cdc20-bound-Mad2 binding
MSIDRYAVFGCICCLMLQCLLELVPQYSDVAARTVLSSARVSERRERACSQCTLSHYSVHCHITVFPMSTCMVNTQHGGPAAKKKIQFRRFGWPRLRCVRCMDRRRPVQVRPAIDVNVQVPYQRDLSAFVCCEIVKAALKLHLYLREQLPMPYDQLARLLHDSEAAAAAAKQSDVRGHLRRPAPVQQRRVAKVVGAFGCLFERLDAAFAAVGTGCISEVLILFGSTYLCPKETVQLLLPTTLLDNGCAGIDDRAADFAAKAVRALLTACCSAMLPRLPLSKIHVLLRVQEQSDDDMLLSPCPWLMPRRQFQLKRSKPHKQPLLSIALSSPGCEAAVSSLATAAGAAVDTSNSSSTDLDDEFDDDDDSSSTASDTNSSSSSSWCWYQVAMPAGVRVVGLPSTNKKG